MPVIAWKRAVISTLVFASAGAPILSKASMPNLRQALSAAALLQSWRDPPSEYGPEPYYGMGGAISIRTLRADLDRIKALGFHAISVQWARGAPFAYLSDAHMAFFRKFVAEAKARDLRIWIVDDAGYPSGFAGGKISVEHPALRMQVLLPVGQWTASGGETLDQPAPIGTVAATAVEAAGNSAQVPLTAGRLHWRAPAGRWTITAIGHAYRTSPTRSETNPANVKDQSQSLEDYLNPAATVQYIISTHEVYRRAVGESFGTTILGFRGDEPDYSVAGLPWTGVMFARFQADKGYDIRPYLAAILSGGSRATGPQIQAARADYYDVFSHVFAAGYFKPLADWCAANRLRYQVHLNHEERQIALAHSEGDFFRALASVQVPGVDAIWHQIWPDTVSDFPRFAASAAHVYGHRQAFTESFAAYRPAPDLATARYIVDEQLVRGINLIEMMYVPSGAMSQRPLAPFMVDPGFPSWARYVSRMSYAMSQGMPAASVALLQPRAGLWLGDQHGDNQFVATERLLSEQQIDFDIVDEDAVAGVLALDPRGFTTRSGNSYHAVIVPHTDALPRVVVDRLRDFSEMGGKVVFLDGPPSRLTGQSYRDAQAISATSFSWAETLADGLDPVPTPPDQPPAAPPPPQDAPVGMRAAVLAASGAQDFRLARASTALRYIHRRLADATLFLLFNESGQRLSNEAILSAKGRRVEVWDAWSGRTLPVTGATKSVEGWRVPLDLTAHQSLLLVLR